MYGYHHISRALRFRSTRTKEGRVKLTRLSDNASTEVAAGQFAVASDALKPVARKIAAPNPRVFAEDFDH